MPRSFNSRTPGGVRPYRGGEKYQRRKFQFTHPGRGATTYYHRLVLPERRFNSRTPGGVRHCPDRPNDGQIWFQFTHPGRGATTQRRARRHRDPFQFTPPGRGATYRRNNQVTHPLCFNSRTPGGVRRVSQPLPPPRLSVSIHAPREGCDSLVKDLVLLTSEVSIHAPREGCDRIRWRSRRRRRGFNSRTPGGVRHLGLDLEEFVSPVSIHAPREGCDVEC